MHHPLPWLVLLLGACGAAPTATAPTPPPPARVPTTLVLTSELDRSLSGSAVVWGGLTTQITATVRDQTGAILPDAPVTWTVSAPDWLSVDGAGRLTVRDSAMGIRFLDVTAQSGTLSARLPLVSADWSLSESVDPVTERRSLFATRSAHTGGTTLYLRCRNGQFEVYVVGSDITLNGGVEYRFSGSAAVTASWLESTDFKALFAPSRTAAKAFADRLLTADTLLFRYGKYLGGTVTSTFLLRNARYAHPRVWERCL